MSLALPPPDAQRRLTLLGAIILIGLVLRVAAARGDYWLDEAWSALFARDAATPGGILFAINHDNNHYLNTLWLHLVGWGSPPMLGRALSIATGTGAIIIAWLIGGRRSLIAAASAALLFAVSPILVTYGSEARGYAPMILAFLTAFWIIDRQLFATPLRQAPEWLGLATLLGMLAHASMLIGAATLIAWVALEQKRGQPWRVAATATIRLTGRMMLAVASVLALAAIGAMASPAGFRVGSLTGFAWAGFIEALAEMIAFTLGWPLRPDAWLLPLLLLPVLLRGQPALQDRTPFYLIAIIGLPLLVALIQPDNSAFPRYYLLSAVALLLLVADLLAAARPRLRYGLIPLLFAGAVTVDLAILQNRRADPGLGIMALRARSPDAATILIDNPRDRAVIEAAAAAHSYRLDIVEECADPHFLFAGRSRTDPFRPIVSRCGLTFQPIASARAHGLSGMGWQLYERSR